jgi:heme-degrading monooxygenase HmoA
MIARTWRGATRADDATAYAQYMRDTGVRELRGTPGNAGVLMIHRQHEGRAEFQVISLWESLESVRAFAGPDIARAVFYPEDEAFLVQRDLVAEHWQVDDALLAGGPA